MKAKVYVDRLNEACKYVQSRIKERPDIGIILGSGLGSYGEELKDPITIPYKEIPQMLDTTVPGHSGCLIFGKVGERKVLCLSGRSHQYEGLYPHEVQFAIRLLAVIGCKLCILTNAAGTRDPELNVGDLAPIEGYTNFTHRGYTEEPLKFVPFNHMIQINMVDADATKVAKEIASQMNLNVKGCIYCYNFGPTYESHSEVEGEYQFGATNFGMSTVPEIIAMKEIGVPLFAMSFVTNKAAGALTKKLSHEDVQVEAKKGEPKMKALISKVIEKVPLKEVPIPKIEGDDHIISRVLPKTFVTDEELNKVIHNFNGTKIDAVIVLGACHTLQIDVKQSIDCNKLPFFPIMQHTSLKFDIGLINNHHVGVFHGFLNLNGPEEHALYYITKLAKLLGASTYIQTFSSGAFNANSYPNVSIVEDIVPFFERPVKTPKLCNKPFDISCLNGAPHCVLASYHGPEFPSVSEAKGINKFGATQVTLGTVKGLLLANAAGLKPFGIADGAYRGLLGSDAKNDTLENVLNSCRGSSEKVCEYVHKIIQSIESHSSDSKDSFTESDVKAIQWNDCIPEKQNFQEDQTLVEKVASALPKNESWEKKDYVAVMLENESLPFFAHLKKSLSEVSTITVHDEWLNVDVNVYNGSYGSNKRKVLLTTESRTLVRAFAINKIKVHLIGKVIPVKDINDKFVSVVDYINLDGVVPLVGRNKSGQRFPDMSYPYHAIEGLPKVTAFSVIDDNEVTKAYAKTIEHFGGGVACQFGVKEGIVNRHAEGNIAFLGVIHAEGNDNWSADDQLIAKFIE
ncbi:hypothetical protein M9Y10_006400 [Tritrichomonas musculus]|uniref:purine-nucleoside phosphorylase n=1 Tax=Tritrichomonas musculus TaxID=1915356 RepID=A0ABR2JEK4_9EUKA